MVAGSLLNFDWTVAIMLFWLLASLLFIFFISAQTCIRCKKSHSGVNDVRFTPYQSGRGQRRLLWSILPIVR
jgi:hypothetical protein